MPSPIAHHTALSAVEGNAETHILVVRTNNGRFAKLLVQAGKQRVAAEKAVPILSIERFITFKEGEERTIQASGQNQSLFAGFRYSLDLGQVVLPSLLPHR